MRVALCALLPGKIRIVSSSRPCGVRWLHGTRKDSHMYAQLSALPVPVSAQFVSSDVISVTSTLQDHTRNAKRTVAKSILLPLGGRPLIGLPPRDLVDVVASVYSPSRTLNAVLREVKKENKATRFVEIWKGGSLHASIETTDAHGTFYTDEHLASLAFSPSETSLLYVAEGLPPSSSSTGSDSDPYRRFRFTPPFGEGIPGKKRPTAFVYRFGSSSSLLASGGGSATAPIQNQLVSLSLSGATLPTLSSPVWLGQGVFSPDGRKLYATGYELAADDRLLGVRWCFNRPTGIWEIDLSPLDNLDLIMEQTQQSSDSSGLPTNVSCPARKLTPSYLSCRSPRILTTAAGMSSLIWLSCPTGGPHAATSSIYALDISNRSAPLMQKDAPPLLPAVFEPSKERDGGFPGLYCDYNLPPAAFIRNAFFDAPQIVTHSAWGSRTTVVLVSMRDGRVRDLTPDEDGQLYSWKVLCADEESGQIVCSRSSLTVPHEVVLGEFDGKGNVAWTVLDKPELPGDVEQALSTLSVSIVPIPGREPCETILMRQNAATAATPCITYPHGGPHTATTTAFTPATVAYALEGYTVSLPNYTGSIGFGENAVRALLGKCGTLDVQDCLASVNHLVKLGVASEGPGKLFVMGGSHGGFLSSHLIGQQPDLFTAAVIRNPVTSAEMSTTDIPDWYYAEFGIEYPLSSSLSEAELPNAGELNRGRLAPILTPELFAKIQKACPISHVDAVRANVLLLLGAVDLRVAPTQGLELYHALRARRRRDPQSGGKIDLLVFDGESHSLDGVEAARICWEAGRDFLAEFRK